MATFTGQLISATYDAIIKTVDNDPIGATAKLLTDGLGNNTPLYVSTTQIGIGITPTEALHVSGNAIITGSITIDTNATISGNLSWGSLTDTGESITITKFVDAADGIANNNNDTTIPTSAAVKSLVDSSITAQDLDFSADSGTGSVDLDSQVFSITGTATQIETRVSGQGIILNLNASGVLLPNGSEATTQAAGDNSTKVATTAFVSTALEGQDTLAEVLAIGNTTGGTDIVVSANDDITFTDTSKAIFGQDLEIYNNSADSKSYITQASGDLIIINNSDDNDVMIQCDDGSGGVTTYLKADGSTGAVQLNHYGLAKLYTSSTGIDINGRISNLTNPSAAQDAATKSYVDSQVGDNNELSEVLANGNTTGGTDIAVSAGDDITFTDTSKALFGAGSDLEIFHDGISSYIKDVGTGSLNILGSGSVRIKGSTADEFMGRFNENGSVQLYYNNVEKLATTSTGISVSGTSSTFAGNVSLGDNKELIFGAASDYKIYHNSTTNVNHISSFIDRQLSINANNIFLTNQANDSTFLLLNSTGATFAGNVGIGLTADTDTALKIKANGNTYSTGNIILEDADSTTKSGITHVNGGLYLSHNASTDDLALTSGNATFAGNVTTGGQITVPSGYSVNIGSSRIHSTDTSYLLGSNVGIGTTLPDHILCIEDTEPTFRIFDTANTLNQEQTISFGTEPGNRTHAEISGINSNTGNAEGGLIFKTNSGASLTERLRIESNGSIKYQTGSGKGYEFGASGSYASAANMFCPSGFTLAFGTNNTERMRLNSSGQLLIEATTSQTTSKLGVRQNGSAIEFGHDNQSVGFYGTLGATYGSGNPFIAFRCFNDSTTGNNNFATQGHKGNVIFSESNGDLVFGQATTTTSSSQPLAVRTRLTQAGNVLINNTAGVSETKLYVEGSEMPATGDAASVEDMFTLYRYGSSTVWSGAASLALGRYSTGDGSNPKSRLDFKLKNVGGTNTALPETTVMTMQSNGAVGIGTTSIPSDHKLQIHNAGGAFARFALTNSVSGVASGDGLKFQLENLNAIIKNQENGYLAFGTNGRETDLKIDSSGNIMMGKTSQSGNAALTVKSTAGGNTGIILVEGDTTNDGWGVYATTANEYRITRFTNGSYSDKFVIDSSGNVGISTTLPNSLLELDGAIGIGGAGGDSNVSISTTAFISQDAGSLHINWCVNGSAASGSTIVFTYAATSWKSWTLKYNFASTNGITQGVIGGYNNNSGGGTNNEDIDNLGCSAVATNSGQTVIVTFTFTALGIHPMMSFVYMQGGNDGQPRADRVSLQANNAV